MLETQIIDELLLKDQSAVFHVKTQTNTSTLSCFSTLSAQSSLLYI